MKPLMIIGQPSSGKNTAAEYLLRRYGYWHCDVGLPIRLAAAPLLGVTPEDLTKQAVKSQMVHIGGRRLTVRQVMGEIGMGLEKTFGSSVFGETAAKSAIERSYSHNSAVLFSGARGDNAKYLAGHYADITIIEIVRPGISSSVADYDLVPDTFESYRLVNDGGKVELYGKLNDMLREELGERHPSMPYLSAELG